MPLQLNNGSILLAPSGVPANASNCCCDLACLECEFCVNPGGQCQNDEEPGCPPDCCTPAVWSVNISGVDGTWCTTCFGPGPTVKDAVFQNVDGIYDLPQTAACTWVISNDTIGAGSNLNIYPSDPGCTGAPSNQTQTVSDSGSISLRKTAENNYVLLISVSLSGGLFFLTSSFSGAAVTTDRCFEAPSLSEDFIVCDQVLFGTTIEVTTGGAAGATATPCEEPP